jgi:hypothetical protein
MQLIKWHNPWPEVVECQWTQYVFLAAQLFASPRAYWEAIRWLHLTIVPVQWWQLFFLRPAQLHAGQLPADECATLTAQYGLFDEPIEDSAILNLEYVGTIEASRQQSDPSDTVSLGHTSPESSISLPASRPMTRTQIQIPKWNLV